MTNGDEDENGNGGGEHDLALIQAASYGIGVASRCCSSSSNSDHNTTTSLNDYVMECVYGLGEAIQFICKILILF